jgi:hypothetical protein
VATENIPNTDAGQNNNERAPYGVLFLGFVAILLSAALAGRLVWEQTVWTWTSGPQMVGFSLFHGNGAPLLLAPILLFVWLLFVVILTLRSLIKGRRIHKMMWVELIVAGAIIWLLLLPYGFWQRLFANRLAQGPYAGEFFTHAAATGDLKTVDAFLSHGVPVDIIDRYGKTGLQAATSQGQSKVVELLLSKGAHAPKE